MRIFLLLIFLVPVLSNAQIQRSAHELADENIHQYLTTRIFKGNEVIISSRSPLKPEHSDNTPMAWSVEQKITVTEPGKDRNTRSYLFTFYLDKKMQVVGARNRKEVPVSETD